MKTLPSVFKHRNNFVDSFDKVFDQLVAKSFPALTDEFGVDFFSKSSYPKVDVLDYKDKIKIISEIPGLTKSDIDIELKDEVLTISGKTNRAEENGTEGTYLYRELKHSAFRRSFTLGDNFKSKDIKAKFKNGILNIEIPKVTPKIEEAVKIDID
jgi:HSP20 family protein